MLVDDDGCDDNDDDCDNNDDKILETFYNWSFHIVTKCLFNQSRWNSILNTVNRIKFDGYDDCNDFETCEEWEMLKKSDGKFIKQ